MGKIISNADIMDMFKEIDEFKSNSYMAEDELNSIIEKKQNKIVNKLSFLVYRQTKQYRNFSNYKDLVQEGFVGLTRAVRKFEWERFPNFFVYSDWWVRHYVKYAASKFDIVYNPNKNRVVYAEPDESEPDESDGPFEMLFDSEKQESINEILREFPERDREIVKMIFGLGGQLPHTLREIGPKFNLTHEGVRQIKNNVLDKLKKNKKIIELNQS